jgi:hypothetical protein
MFRIQSGSPIRRWGIVLTFATALAVIAAEFRAGASPGWAPSFFFGSGAHDGRMAAALRPGRADLEEIESAGDFTLTRETFTRQATLTGLLPPGAGSSDVTEVVVEIDRVFTDDAPIPSDEGAPAGNDLPSEAARAGRDGEVSDMAGRLELELEAVADSLIAENSVLDGIHPLPEANMHGEGSVSREEVRFEVTFPKASGLPAGHPFFIPRWKLESGKFLRLPAPKPMVAPVTPLAPDPQDTIRNQSPALDWLRAGDDIVGGASPPDFRGAYAPHRNVSHEK